MRFYIVALCLMCFNSTFLNAQNCPNNLPSSVWLRGNFTVPAQACVNQAINVFNVGTTTNVKYIYNYKSLADTANSTPATSFVYSQAGVYLIVQIGTINGRKSFACNRIVVVNNPKPTFSLIICNNATVVLTINSVGLPYSSYLVNWGDGTAAQTFSPAQRPVHTYSSNTPVSIVVTGVFNGVTCTGVSNPVQIIPQGTPAPLPKITKVEVLDDKTVELTYQGWQSNIKYELRQRLLPLPITNTINNATFTTVGLDTKVRITGLNTLANVYGYTLNLTTSCGNFSTTVSTTEVYSMSLQNVATPNYQNNLSWRPNAGGAQPNQFKIVRDSVQIGTTQGNQFNYSDTKALCGKKYNYQVVASFTGNPTYSSYSNIKSATTQPIAQPLPLTEVLTNVKDDNTALIYVVNTPINTRVKSYLLERADGFTLSSTKTVFTDSTAKTGTESVCYKLSYSDVCERTTVSTKDVCTIFLQAKGEILKWTPELPFLSKIQIYTVERLDAQGRTRKNYAVSIARNEWEMDSTDLDQEVYYRVRATSANRISAVSNVVYTFRPMKIYAPTAFTPNGDNINDTFEFKGLFVKSANINIYSRNGHLVYETQDWKKSWNGTLLNGTPAENGTYVYTVQATDLKGNAASISGTVEVLR